MLRLGFIGAGGYGRVQLDGFLALQAQGLVKIVALADPAPAVLKELAELPALKTARCFLDYRELLDVAELDAVVISAPIPLHEEMTLAALARDLFVLLEKPPVPLLSQLERLIAADVHGRVMVGFQHIYSDLVRNLKRELVAGQVGRILSISARGLWPRDTAYYDRSDWAGQLVWRGRAVLDGPCTNGFAHFLNLVHYFAGTGEDSFALPAQVIGEAYRARPTLNAYDTGCLTGALENGVRFFIGFSHASKRLLPVEVQIQGVEGKVRLSEDGQALQSENGQIAHGSDGRENLRRSFLAFAAGDPSQNKTALSTTRSYVLATNLMLASSSGIHSIPEKYVHTLDEGTAQCIYAVNDLATFLDEASAQLSPLCQTSAPWARKNSLLTASNFSEAEFRQTLPLADSMSLA